MTRFIITADEAIDLIYEGLNHDGVSIIPKAKSILVRHLFEIYSKSLVFRILLLNLAWEKIHEACLTWRNPSHVQNLWLFMFFT